MEKLSLETLMQGAVQEKFEKELKRVLENIMDPNTDFKKKRKLTIDFEFITNEERDETLFDCIVKSKIIPAKPVVSRLLIGKDGEGVKVTEYQKGIIPGQVIVDVETGEVTDGIIDFKKIGEN